MSEIGLFCGTFNPVHIGHLLIAEAAREQYRLDRLLLVLSPQPPHRKGGLLDAEARYTLVQAACKTNPAFEPSRLELDRGGPSYTVDTVRAVREKYQGARVNLVIGGDNLPYLQEWHEIHDLLKMVRLLVVPRLRLVKSDSTFERTGELAMDLEHVRRLDPDVDVAPVDFAGIGISASSIREKLKRRQSILYMVPESVHEIIEHNNYYAETVGKP